MNKTCYLLVGLPGSGKTTAAIDLLADIPNVKIVSSDDYIEAIAKERNSTYKDVYWDCIKDAEKWMKKEIQENIKANNAFIWDQTNVYLSARKKKIAMLHQNKYSVVAIVIELSEEELQKRLRSRVQQGGKSISEKILNELKLNYSRPEYSEGFSEIYLLNDDSVAKKIPNGTIKLNNRG